MTTPPTFDSWLQTYDHSGEANERVYQALTAATWADPVLAAHRRHVETRELGFGDPAFHAMWAMLVDAATQRFGSVRAMEIGVYKGQVISLWALLAQVRQIALEVWAISPLRGNPHVQRPWLDRLRYRLDRRFREQVDNGNFYPDEDYRRIVADHFAHHGLDFAQVQLLQGYSTDPAVMARAQGQHFHLLYIDGDHRYEGVVHDLRTYAPLVVPGGWMVTDDSASDLPGNGYWKGHEAVSRAVRQVPDLGFRNVLNVGHCRIFERLPPG